MTEVYSSLTYVAMRDGQPVSAGPLGPPRRLPDDLVERHTLLSHLMNELPGGPVQLESPEATGSSFRAKAWAPMPGFPDVFVSFCLHFMNPDSTPWRPVEDGGLNPYILGLENETPEVTE